MGRIAVHEFVTLDRVIEDPAWTFDHPFDPKMGEAIATVMGSCDATLLGRRTYEEFAPAWSGRSAEDEPGAPFMNESPITRSRRCRAQQPPDRRCLTAIRRPSHRHRLSGTDRREEDE